MGNVTVSVADGSSRRRRYRVALAGLVEESVVGVFSGWGTERVSPT
jgi:hypothetical protein